MCTAFTSRSRRRRLRACNETQALPALSQVDAHPLALLPVLCEARMIESLEFTVYTKPEPQGSSRGFIVKGPRPRVAITSDNKNLKPFRQEMALSAMCASGHGAFKGDCATLEAVRLDIDFYFSKPKSAKKRIHHTVKPDLDKLARASLDAFTGILYADDSQVSELTLRKLYGLPERVEVRFRAAATATVDSPDSNWQNP